MKKHKIKKDFPRYTIERMITDKDGHLFAVDLHDEKFGEALFFMDGARHYHGFKNYGKYKEE